MSRADFWTIAATLIVTGVAYFVGGQKTAYGCLGLGIVIIIVLLLTHKKPDPVAVNTQAMAEANPQMTANPQMNVNVNLPGSQKQEKVLAPPKPKPQHNLRLHSCRMAQIEESMGPHGEMGGFHFTDDQAKPNAAVICIKNKSKEGEVAYMQDVRAALIFRDNNGHEIGNGISQACWVNNHLRNASFDLEESKCVIVAVMKKDAKGEIVGVVAPYIREQMTHFGPASNVEAYELNENLGSIELILLSKNSRVMEPMKFEIFLEDSKPGIRLITDER